MMDANNVVNAILQQQALQAANGAVAQNFGLGNAGFYSGLEPSVLSGGGQLSSHSYYQSLVQNS